MVVTNLKLNAENIWRLYNKGAVVEQVIEEIKNDFAATGIRTNEFWANDTLFETGLIAYNLLNCIRRLLEYSNRNSFTMNASRGPRTP